MARRTLYPPIILPVPGGAGIAAASNFPGGSRPSDFYSCGPVPKSGNP